MAWPTSEASRVARPTEEEQRSNDPVDDRRLRRIMMVGVQDLLRVNDGRIRRIMMVGVQDLLRVNDGRDSGGS